MRFTHRAAKEWARLSTAGLARRPGEVAKELETAEADWLEVSEQLEALAA